jgi:hypothetical protein
MLSKVEEKGRPEDIPGGRIKWEYRPVKERIHFSRVRKAELGTGEYPQGGTGRAKRKFGRALDESRDSCILANGSG